MKKPDMLKMDRLKTIRRVIVLSAALFLGQHFYCPDLTGRTLTIGISSSILSLDPTNHRDRDTQMVLKNMFDSLTTRDKHLLVVPQLAESWHPVDPVTWEFILRRGVTFHNGDAFTAQDVKFTLERVTRAGAINGRTSPRKTLLGRISEVNIIDPYTIQIITDGPWPILPLMLTLQEIVPSGYFEKLGGDQFVKKPVGTGPYKFVEKNDSNSLTLERFDDYYGGAHENPPVQAAPLDRLVFTTVAEPIRRIAMLKKGEFDIVTDVPLEATQLLSMHPTIEVVSQPATRSYFADVNCGKPPLDDRRVRRALNYALDRSRMVNAMFQGKAQVLPTILLKQAFGFNSALSPYPYDPNEARAALRAANFPFDHTIQIVCIAKYKKFADSIVLYLSKMGIRSKLTIDTKSRVRAAMKNLKADILVTSWGNTTLDPVGILVPKLKSDGRGNFSGYANEKVDELLRLAESTLDQGKRSDYYQEVQSIIYDDAPMIFGYASEEFYGVRGRVKGFFPSATGMLNLHDVTVQGLKEKQ